MKKYLLALAVSAAFASSASAAIQSVDAGSYIFSYDDSFWGTNIPFGPVFSQSGNTFTFSNLGYEASENGLRSGDKVGYYNDSTYDPVISVLAKANYRVEAITLGATGQLSTTIGASQQASASADAQLVAYWNSWSGPYVLAQTYSQKDRSDTYGVNGSYNIGDTVFFEDDQKQVALTFYGINGNVTANGLGSTGRSTFDTSYFTVQVSAIPEPASYAMVLAGLAIVGAMGRRRSRSY